MLAGLAAILGAVAWPIVAGFAVWKFHEPIGAFIARLTSVEASPTGIKGQASAPNQQITKDITSNTDDEKAIEAVKFGPMDPVYRAEYDDIKAFLEKNSNDTASNLEAALRLFALVATERKFERIHRTIFGSQIQAVINANAAGGKLKIREINTLYAEAVRLNPAAYENFGFDKWLKFPVDVGLLKLGVGSDGENYAEVTPSGRAYLQYAVAAQLPIRAL